ncbi:hypothetical protein ABMA28_011678 [Loxostege sticticalis]|uniref:RNase H type-1 domain-containing protein n=1 Tax=Loxostege sticticalis TaxID=481309 RepID=A0ABD0T4P8_LOXSC
MDPCNKSALDKFDKIQSKCLRIILGAMKSSPINALQIESVDPPLYLRRQYLSDRFFLKVIHNSSHPLLEKLHYLSTIIDPSDPSQKPPCILLSYHKFNRLPTPIAKTSCNPLFLNSFESLIFKPNIILNFGISKDSPGARTIFLKNLSSNWHDSLHLYTDASKLTENGEVGAAVWIPKFQIALMHKCPPLSSTFTGESVAILEAILFVESHNIEKSIIFTDSLSCLQAIESNPFRSKTKFPTILKIRETLLKCKTKGLDVTLAWIPSHNGIPGNETADSCAKNAISLGSQDHYKLYSHDLPCLARSHLLRSWSSDWQITRRKAGKFYFDVQGSIETSPWFFKHKRLSKRVISVISRLRLGHTSSPVHLAKIRVKDNSICECGIDEGSADHILFNCPNVGGSLYDHLPDNISRPCNVKCLLSLINTPFLETLSKFIEIYKIKL